MIGGRDEGTATAARRMRPRVATDQFPRPDPWLGRARRFGKTPKLKLLSSQTQPRFYSRLNLRQRRAIDHAETADKLRRGHTPQALGIEAAGIEPTPCVRHLETSARSWSSGSTLRTPPDAAWPPCPGQRSRFLRGPRLASVRAVFLFVVEREGRIRGVRSLPVFVQPSRQLFHFLRRKSFDGGFDFGHDCAIIPASARSWALLLSLAYVNFTLFRRL